MSHSDFLKTRLQIENERTVFDVVVTAPKKLVIELTNICNHRCAFCANGRMTRRKGVIDLNLAESVLEQAADMGVRELSLVATGEPFACPHIDRVIKAAKTKGFTYVYVTTNGGIATIEKIRSAIESGLDSIKFSFNAGTRETYNRIHGRDDFDKVLERIRQTSEYREKSGNKFPLGISFVMSDINRHERPLAEKLFRDVVDDILFVEADTQAGYNVSTSLKGMSVQCIYPFATASVTHEGYLTLCCVDFQNYLAVADLNETTLEQAWNGETIQKARKAILENNMGTMLCHRCMKGKNMRVEPLIPRLATLNDDIFAEITL